MDKGQRGEPRSVGSALLLGAALPDLSFQGTATSFMGLTLISLQPSRIQSTKGPEQSHQQPRKGAEGSGSAAWDPAPLPASLPLLWGD